MTPSLPGGLPAPCSAPPRPAPLEQVEAAVRAVPDPEIPVITIDDLGVIRSVERGEPGAPQGSRPVLDVVITPTYSGCPAMHAMAAGVEQAAARHGWLARVTTQLSPPWTTDWMSEDGRRRLREFGIAPPDPARTPAVGAPGAGPVAIGLSVRQVACPLCGSPDTEELARFGSTACKALRRCLSCREPFDEFKPL